MLIVFVVGAYPQQRKTASQRSAPIATVHVIGSQRFTETDVVAASGLVVGEAATPADFQVAANRLVASGAFETVEYKYAPAGNGYAVTFQLEDQREFLPVRYENFVWFTQKELTDAVHKSVPLFAGSIARAGDMVEQVRDALQRLINERGINGDVRFAQEEEADGSATAALFSIDGPRIRVREVKFPGANDAELPYLQKAAEKLTSSPYRRFELESFCDSKLKPYYEERGFLKISFGTPEFELLDKNPDDPVVALSIPIHRGTQYRVADIAVTGVDAFDAANMLSSLRVKPGAVADLGSVKRDVESIKQMYGAKGYVRATIEVGSNFDDSRGVVSYLMKVDERGPYRFGSLDVEGLGKETNARVREAWTIREGEPYDANYEREYVKKVGGMLAKNVTVEVDRQIDDQARVVHVTVLLTSHEEQAKP